MQRFNVWDERLRVLQSAYQRIGAEVRYEKAPPAGEREVLELERRLGRMLPPSLRETLLRFSGALSFAAYLPERFPLSAALREIFSACFLISLAEIENAEQQRREWAASCFQDPGDAYDRIWHHKLAFMCVGNGDLLACDWDDPADDKRVVYLSHDGGEGHGAVLGQSFGDYFDRLLQIGGCGPEDWQMLPFLEDGGLDADGANARNYRACIGLPPAKAVLP